jgi:hypothetical protein
MRWGLACVLVTQLVSALYTTTGHNKLASALAVAADGAGVLAALILPGSMLARAATGYVIGNAIKAASQLLLIRSGFLRPLSGLTADGSSPSAGTSEREV